MSKTDPTKPVLSEATKTPASGVIASIHGEPVAAKKVEERPSEKIVAFVKDHPMVLIAGGIAVGALATALLPRPIRGRVTRRAMSLAEIAGTAALALGNDLDDGAHEFGRNVRTKAKRYARSSAKASESTIDQVEAASEKAAKRLEKLGVAALTSASAISRSATKRAEKFGGEVADESGRLMKRARKIKSRIFD